VTGEQPLSVMISAVTKVRGEGGRNRKKEKTEGLREGGIMGGSKGRRGEERMRKGIGYQCRTVFLQGEESVVTCSDIPWYTVIYCDILWYTVVYCDGILWYTMIYCGIL